MSSKQKIVYLDEIRPWKTAWLIEAKILHTGPRFMLHSLGEQCKVGEWKTLYNFQVSATGKHYRPTQHMYKITFINQTVIKPSEFQNDDMFLSLATFDSIMSGKLDNDILIDIIGQAIEVGEIRTLQCGGKEKKKIEFQLRDFAEDMESHREEAQFGVVVCLIRFAKIGAFRGNLQISNGYDSSQLVFNPNIKEAEEIREAYKFHDDSLSIVETSEEGKDIVSQANNGTRQKLTGWETVEVKTISEILNFTQLHLVAKDDTAKAKFVLLDWVAWPVIGVKAEKILNGSLDEVEDPEMLPDCINEIVGKTYNFGVTIEKGSETFKVLKVWSVYNTLMVDSQSESISGKGITANSASEVSLLTYSDESSSKMATPSKRSVDDIVDIPDNTSTSKMRHVKSIKIEKMSTAKIVKLSLAKIEDQDVLPPEIVEIVGKTYGFGFSDDDNNMIGGADVSTAMKVWNLNDIMWKRIKSLHQMSTYSRKKQCTNDEGDKNKIYLDEIRPWKTAWLIEAKILHTWKPSNASFGESLEIVMSDKKGTKIHATCKKNYLQSLGEQCKVGEWKTLYNFQVSATGKHYRPTQHMYKITFINQTVIKPSEFQNDDMFLSLATFDSIMSGKLDNDILIDIIGQAIEVGEIRTLQCGGKEKKKIEFQLRDVSDERIPCCLWGKFAEDMESHREEAQFGVVVCLIRFAKIGAFRGNLQISNGYDSSQLVFNPNIKEAEEIREAYDLQSHLTIIYILNNFLLFCILTPILWDCSYKFHDDSLSIVETSEEGKDIVSQANNGTRQKLTGWETVEVKTISEILNFTQNVMNVKPRYKLHLVAKDDTAKAKFVLLDWVAWPVIGVKAEKILNGSLDEVEDPEMLPDCINEIVGKTYNFGVTIEKGSETFKVLKVWSVYNTLMVDSQSESISGKGITANSASEVSLLTYSDESSSKMATPSKRSVDDIVDIPDNTSTSKMRHVKSIKIEKMSSDELALRKN
ncbi:hypothetical protein HID58_037611 [Brassica napus]|uniref:Replication protein A 70 kDa DNA-binding subunit B/D first OB fold domain-containing protein n=1 Tax=Brassica napus TaxID=3708 RepID=A0ABQ8BLT3_BRANA|nr:hypothetical protein HID58_037611 [Brassica napus]